MTAWVLRVGRLAWARERYSAVGGWRRLWWRLWWWEGERPPKRLNAPPRPAPAVQGVGYLHWAPDARPLPFCGALGFERWTLDYAAVDCPKCRQLGWGLHLQNWVSNR